MPKSNPKNAAPRPKNSGKPSSLASTRKHVVRYKPGADLTKKIK